ncbi:MAG: 7TM diverse intracellular signaling domain-containing protein [Ferruginibacter sp.]
MLKKPALIALFVLLNCIAFGQQTADSNVVNIAVIKDSAMAVNKTLLFIDSNDIATLDNLLQQKFTPLSAFPYKKSIRPELVSKYAYLQITLSNSDSIPQTVYYFPGTLFDNIIFYERTAMGLQHAGDGSRVGYCSLTMPAFSQKTFIIKLDFCRHEYDYIRPIIIRSQYMQTFQSVYTMRKDDIKNVGFLLSGMLFMMILFIGVNYILTRKKEFLYYIGYAFLIMMLVFLYALLGAAWGSFTSFFNGYLDAVLLISGNVFYLAFSRHFLNTKTNYKTLDKVFKLEEWILLSLLVVFTIAHYFTDWYVLEQLLENIMKVVVLVIGIIFIIIAFKQKERLIIYLAVGSAFAIFFNIISLAIIFVHMPLSGIFTYALFYHNIGLVFALAAFLLGLTYKNRRELVERTKEQEALKLDVEKKDFERQIAVIKAQQEERNRISADMHDDLGAGMTTIRLYSELAKNKIGDTPIPEIEKISSSANELLNKMNAIIWSMSSSNDSLGNMVAYIRSYSLEYFEDSGIHCKISLPENIPNLVVSGEIRRNVFLVVKEALNNVLKHSKATEVAITLEQLPSGLRLLIQDNGVGINFDKLKQFGNGLKNMKKRMEDMNIQFSIENNKGTLVTLFGPVDHMIFL